MVNIENYRAISLSSVPDCCGVCLYGDTDGEGCDILMDNGFGATEKQLNTGFNYFFVCDQFKRTQHDHAESLEHGIAKAESNQSLKIDQSCKTCKFRNGTKCRKSQEYITDNDWCSAYKR